MADEEAALLRGSSGEGDAGARIRLAASENSRLEKMLLNLASGSRLASQRNAAFLP